MNSKYSSSICSDIIKLYWVKKNIKKYGGGIKKITNSSIFSDKDFDAFVDLISKEDTTDYFKNYFINLKSYVRINGLENSNMKINTTFVRTILCAYTILFFPEVMNIDESNAVSKLLLEKAKSLTLNIKLLLMLKLDKFSFAAVKTIRNFMTKCKEFLKIFNEWKNIDMEAVICNLAKIYMNIERDFQEVEENTKSDDESTIELLRITKNNVESEKEKILKKVKKMNSKHGIEIFNKYYIFLNQEFDLNVQKTKLAKSINDNIQKAYWDVIESDMLKVPPDFEKIISLLEEAKILLKQCVPNRQDLIKEIDMFLEVETLKHYIENDIDVNEFISNMFTFIINKIKEFQARAEEESFNKFLVDFNKLRSQDTCRLSEMLIFFFQGIMPRLDLIVQSKRSFEEWYSKNINK
jgi:hypothetical protein